MTPCTTFVGGINPFQPVDETVAKPRQLKSMTRLLDQLGPTFVSINQLIAASGMCRRLIAKNLKELKDEGVVVSKKLKRTSAKGRSGVTCWALKKISVSEWQQNQKTKENDGKSFSSL